MSWNVVVPERARSGTQQGLGLARRGGSEQEKEGHRTYTEYHRFFTILHMVACNGVFWLSSPPWFLFAAA